MPTPSVTGVSAAVVERLSPVLSLTYLSSATRLLSEPELGDLLARSRAKNKALGLSGMLLHSDGNFIQTLEGPEEAVRSAYRTISADPRHRGHLVVLEEAITERCFPDWAMGFRGTFDALSQADGSSGDLRDRDHALSGAGSAPQLMRIFRDSLR